MKESDHLRGDGSPVEISFSKLLNLILPFVKAQVSGSATRRRYI